MVSSFHSPGVAISVLFEHLWHLFFGRITVLPLREFNDRLPLLFVSRRFSVRPRMTRTTTLRSFLCPDGVWHSGTRGRRHTMFLVNSTSGIVVVTIFVTVIRVSRLARMWQRAPVDQHLCSTIIFIPALKTIHNLLFWMKSS